jgi:hypothetical protein
MKDAMARQGFDAAAIDTAVQRASMDIPDAIDVPQEMFQPLTLEERAGFNTPNAPPPSPD